MEVPALIVISPWNALHSYIYLRTRHTYNASSKLEKHHSQQHEQEQTTHRTWLFDHPH